MDFNKRYSVKKINFKKKNPSKVLLPEYKLYVTYDGKIYDLRNNEIPFMISDKGYKYIEFKYLNQSGSYTHTRKTVHSLVAKAYLGDKPEKHEVNHKDGNKLNNWASNLEYMTHHDNIKHAINVLNSDFRRKSVR